jgi:heptosyltransferase III
VRILIIRPGAIGDALLTFHILKILKAQYAHSQITFVSNANVLPLAKAFGLVEEASDYAHSSWSELFSTEGIRTPAMQDVMQQTDLAICWLRDPDGMIEHNLLKAGVQHVIVAPGRPSEGERIHVVDYLATTIGLQNVGYNGKLIDLRRGEGGVAIHPGSGGTHKCWPAHNFTVVIEHLIQGNIPVLLLAGPADAERVQNMLDHLSSQCASGMLKVLENAPLLEVAEHLQQCRGYLGNDSGITHLAAMLGVPTLALFGPTDPLIWRPVGTSVRVVQEYPLERLHVDVVMGTMNSFYLNRAIERYRTSGM